MRAIAVLVLTCGCTTASDPPHDTPPLRDTLFDTGLCLDRACTQIASDAIEYQPRFELWANGAAKRRWIQLPAGAKIDTLLGFEAIQLDHDVPVTDLRDVNARGWLSKPPAGTSPFFPLPGNATVHAAFGYLHANCSGCHSTSSYVRDDTPLDLVCSRPSSPRCSKHRRTSRP